MTGVRVYMRVCTWCGHSQEDRDRAPGLGTRAKMSRVQFSSWALGGALEQD